MSRPALPSYSFNPIGVVHSEIKNRADAPKQGSEGAPDAWLEMVPEVAAGLDGIEAGDEVIVITWLDRGNRDVLRSTLEAIRATRSRASSRLVRPIARTRSASTGSRFEKSPDCD
jgi:tRNA (Thr-GGU) A37 N-methylase